MKYLIILIGLPGSGKSTLAKKIVEMYACDFFSSEIIGAQIDCYQSVKEDRDFTSAKQEKIYEKLAHDVFLSLQTNSVVVEGVFRSNAQREKIDAVYSRMKRIYEDLSYIKFWITCDAQIAIERVDMRKEQGTVSPSGVNAFFEIREQFERPMENERFIVVDNSNSFEDTFNKICTCINEAIRFPVK